jgi:uncharacterized membrane protein
MGVGVRTARRAAPITVLTLVSLCVIAIVGLNTFRQFRGGYDLTIFSQAIHNYSEFKAPIVAVKGPHFNILGDHFHPILVVLAPLYWIWDDPRVLLIAQAVLLAASVPIVYRFAARYLSPRLALLISAGYALGWPLQASAASDFYEIAFGVPLLAWAIDSLDRRDDRGLLIAGGLLLLVREDMGTVVALLGLLRLTRAPRRTGLALLVSGIGVYFLATQVVLPHFSSTGRFGYWSYDALGATPGSALRSIIVHPWHAVRLFFTPVAKSHTLLFLFAPLAFVSLRSRYSLLLLPLLAERFFSSREALWTTQYHYSAIAWPVLFLAGVDGLNRLKVHRIPRRLWCSLPLAFALVGTALSPGVFPYRHLIDGQLFATSAHLRAQEAAVALVPKDSCVVTDDDMVAHFTAKDLVSLPGRLGRVPDYTVLDLSRTVTGSDTPSPQQALATALARGDVTVFSRDQIVVLRSAQNATCHP